MFFKLKTNKLLFFPTVFFAILMQSQITLGQVTANFIADDSLGCESLIVKFTNLSSGGDALTYNWDFGNGNSSTSLNPQIAFVGKGSYTITLITRDANLNLSDTLIKENYIQIVNKPKISFSTPSERIGCAPLSVEFQPQLISADAPISNYVWDFGDDSFSTDSFPQNSYSLPGSYTVSVNVTDTNGCSGNTVNYNYITVNQSPRANFISSTPYSCLDTLTVKFTNQSTGAGNLNYYWKFGDGSVSSDIHPVHTYSGKGSYSVHLSVVDGTGCTDSLIKNGQIILKPINQNITIEDGPVCRNTSLGIANNSVGVNTYSWDFGDGTTSNQAQPEKKYTSPGWFYIKVITSFYSVCADTLVDSIYVDPIKAGFESDKNYDCQLPSTVHFTDHSISATNWQWKFGNGQISVQKNPTLLYDQSLKIPKNKSYYFSDTLIATSSNFCSDTLVQDSSMLMVLPNIYFTPNDSSHYENLISGCVPITVAFVNKSTTMNELDPFQSWEWDLGDGTKVTTKDASYQYQTPGEFPVVLTAINVSGCKNTFNAEIKTGTPQSANFTYHAPTIICGSDAVEFINTSVEDSLINKWAWLFSDQGQSSLKNMFYTYSDTGYASATLTVFYNGCQGSTIKKDSITYVNGPAGKFQTTFDCKQPFDYQFVANLSGVDHLVWDFGDSSFDSTQNQTVSHTFSSTGRFDVKLSAINNSNLCQLTVIQPINIRDLHGSLEVLSNFGCKGEPVSFDPTLSQDVNIFLFEGKFYKYLWDFGDSTDVVASNEAISHIYAKKGVFPAKLTVFSANDCKEELIKNIHVFKPTAGFDADQVDGCLPFPVQFSDHSYSDTTLVFWNWDFGSGQLSSLQNPLNVYETNGKFTTTLIAVDAAGCKDTLIKEGFVQASRPIPQITLAAHDACVFDSILFTNLSVGFGLTASWNFGDLESSTEFNPKHAYNDTGSFDVTLYMQDSLGCDTTWISRDFITIHNLPEPDFVSDLYQTSCYPALVRFTHGLPDEPVAQWEWDFGDGTKPNNQENPLHTYYQPGLFDVQLKATTGIGCVGETIKQGFLNIGGPFAEITLPDVACKGIQAIITLTDSLNIFDFKWFFDDGTSSSKDTTYKTYNSFGKKTILLSLRSDSINTCNKIISDSVTVPVIISRFSVADSMDCVPFTVGFNDQSTNAQTFWWNFGNGMTENSQNPSHTFNVAGNFNVMLRVEEKHHCPDSSYKNVVVFPLPVIDLSNDTLICKEDTILLQVSGGSIYQWGATAGITETNSNQPHVFPLQNTTFHVQVTDDNACKSVDSVVVLVQQPPEAIIQNPDTIQLIVGESVDLIGEQSGGDSFFWTPENFVTCILCLETSIKPLNDTMSYFSVSDQNGCFTVRDSVFMLVDYKFSLDVPNAFTPNNDNVNDQILVKGWGIKELMEFIIYDANNKQVFKTADLLKGWDGTYNGQRLDPGVYFYMVKVISYDNEIRTKKGYIYLLK